MFKCKDDFDLEDYLDPDKPEADPFEDREGFEQAQVDEMLEE